MRTKQATLQMSARAPQSLRPMMASGDRYWRVWISSVKCFFEGVALPRSAILMEISGTAQGRSFGSARAGVWIWGRGASAGGSDAGLCGGGELAAVGVSEVAEEGDMGGGATVGLILGPSVLGGSEDGGACACMCAES